ncbi:hypothetical protein ACQ86N_16670 [Puia sp. P3]|uniref:hypothetical protein n=1 Tax=Puia sp. P3 TaxID=3423952 RepID=UPI003D677898
MGTADSRPLFIRTNNIISGYLDSAKASAFLGYDAGNSTTTGVGNTALGKQSLSSVTTGSANVAVGDSALYSMTEGVGAVSSRI